MTSFPGSVLFFFLKGDDYPSGQVVGDPDASWPMQTFGSRTKVEGVMMGARLSYQQHALHANALGVTRSSGPDLGICTLAAWHRDRVLIGEAILCPHLGHHTLAVLSRSCRMLSRTLRARANRYGGRPRLPQRSFLRRRHAIGISLAARTLGRGCGASRFGGSARYELPTVAWIPCH